MALSAAVPSIVRTTRLVLRPWRATDAARLLPLLEQNVAHLSPWIPRHVWSPAPVDELAARLDGFAADFISDTAWRYAMFTLDEAELLGELALFPRDDYGRVPLRDANRVEMGYWLRADRTGQGFATEAARAAITVAGEMPRFVHIEIRCDARNASSAAVPRRLDFELSATFEEPSESEDVPPVALQIWSAQLHALSRAPSSPSNSLV